MGRDFLHDNGNFQVIGGLVSPVNDGYKKEGLASSVHRLNMCRLAVADSEWIDVDEWELSQSSYKRTLEVLNNIQLRLDHALPGSKVMFLAGADLIRSFATPGLWDPDDRVGILSKYGCVVVDRWNSDISEFLLIDPILYKYRKQIHVVKQFISNDISSTKLRLYIERGLSVKYLLPDPVLEYIKKNLLYKITHNHATNP